MKLMEQLRTNKRINRRYSDLLFGIVCALKTIRTIHGRIKNGLALANYEWVDFTVVLDGMMADITSI